MLQIAVEDKSVAVMMSTRSGIMVGDTFLIFQEGDTTPEGFPTYEQLLAHGPGVMHVSEPAPPSIDEEPEEVFPNGVPQ